MSSIQNIAIDIIAQFLLKHNEVTTRGMYASDVVAELKKIAKTKNYSPMSHFSSQASVERIIVNTQKYELLSNAEKKKTWKINKKSDITQPGTNEISESSDFELSISEKSDIENNNENNNDEIELDLSDSDISNEKNNSENINEKINVPEKSEENKNNENNTLVPCVEEGISDAISTECEELSEKSDNLINNEKNINEKINVPEKSDEIKNEKIIPLLYQTGKNYLKNRII